MHTAAQEQQQLLLVSVTGSSGLQELPACSNSSKAFLQAQHEQVKVQLVQQHQQQHLLPLLPALASDHL
jgi:hypothetical protein